MPDVALLWLIPAAPLAAAVLIAFAGSRWLRGASHWPCVVAIGVSALCAITLLVSSNAHEQPITSAAYQWFSIGDLAVPVAI